MAAIEPERCHSCHKVFCCAECCANHIKSKHPDIESQCPLCRSEPLIVGKLEHPELLSHLATKHLPLRCRSCAQTFATFEDLKDINNCNRHPLIRIEPPTFIEMDKSSRRIDEAQSPPNSISELIYNKRHAIVGCYNDKFSHLTSPPEFTRHTSTPMHLNTNRASPVSFSMQDRLNESSVLQNIYETEVKSNYHYVPTDNKSMMTTNRTPLRSILIKSSVKETKHNVSIEKLTSVKQLYNDSENMEPTNVQGAVFTDLIDTEMLQPRNKDLSKKVRFSEQLGNSLEPGANVSTFRGSEVDEFFDAHQSISEMSGVINDNPSNFKEEKSERASENCNPKAQSSRVVMMVLVEENRDGTTDTLVPFINSGFKTLESMIAASDGFFSTKKHEEPSERLDIASVEGYRKISIIERYHYTEGQKVPLRTLEPTNHGKGIFSAVANFVKSAIKSLSGTPMHITDEETGSYKYSRLEMPKHQTVSSTFDEIETSSPESRPGKRSRENIDPVVPDLADRRSRHTYNDVRSPLQKRMRSGYQKIRGRPPLSRMRDLSSPRGVSSETQCFRQGSLSVGDTILPLPSRAHQSSQLG